MKDYTSLLNNLKINIFEYAGPSKKYKISSEEIKEYILPKFKYFTTFFNVSDLSDVELYNFLFVNNNSNDLFIDCVNNLIEYLPLNEEEYLFYFCRFKKNESFNLFAKEIKTNNNAIKFYRGVVLAVLWFAVSLKQFSSSDFYENEEIARKFFKEEMNDYYFRGEANYNWALQPSILRNFSYNKKDGCLITKETLFEFYNRRNLIEKYNKTIGQGRIKSYKDIDYKFLSFMQHAASYSPLLDFTSNVDSAYVFALNNEETTNFNNNDSAIYALNYNILKFNQPVGIDPLNHLKIYYLNKRIKPGTYMEVEDKDEIIKLNFTTLDSILNWLTPSAYLYEEQTNDRMIYQQGYFLLFYNCLLVNGDIFYSFNYNLLLSKHKIRKEYKQKINKIIKKDHKELDMEYLMNPYKYFID